jgi:predicted DNA-binding transcriptional regulator AlpA
MIDAPKFLDITEVSKRTTLGKSTILAWEAQGRFPLAVRLSKTRRVWLESDVHNWMNNAHKELEGLPQ